MRKIQALLTHRLVNLYGFLAGVFAMLFALFYLQQYLQYDPCPLCILQRVSMIATAGFFLLAFLHNPKGALIRLYGIFSGLAAVSGIIVAGRHVWLQHLPADQVPSCGPGLEYMLETFPMMRTFELVFRGSGECAEVHWSFLGLSIPEATLLAFIGLLALSIFNIFRPAASAVIQTN